MKLFILKLAAFAMLATNSVVYASDESSPTRSLRGSPLAEDDTDAEFYWNGGWNGWNGGYRWGQYDESCRRNCNCPQGEVAV